MPPAGNNLCPRSAKCAIASGPPSKSSIALKNSGFFSRIARSCSLNITSMTLLGFFGKGSDCSQELCGTSTRELLTSCNKRRRLLKGGPFVRDWTTRIGLTEFERNNQPRS